MKKHISIAVTVALMMVVAFGCKVGADDPASLASRDGRIMATWKLSTVNGLSSDIITIANVTTTTTTTSTYNGTIWTEIDNPGSTSTIAYTLSMTIEKDGLLSWSESEGTSTDIGEGSWQWLNDDQKKSQILINDGPASGVWTVTRLTGKELVVDMKYKRTITDTGYSQVSEDAMTYTFAAE